jgi:FdhD protein
MLLRIHDIWISPGHDFKGRHGLGRESHGTIRLDEARCEAGLGIVGDRYHGKDPNSKTQVTLLLLEVVEEMCRHLGIPHLDYSVLRRNVLVSGIDLNGLIGKKFTIGEVEFEGVEECKPCYWMDEAVGPGANAFLAGRGGLRCRILTGGTLRCGDAEFNLPEARSKPCPALLQDETKTRKVIDELTVERALQILLNGSLYSVTMQTPGDEGLLVRGLLHSEGIDTSGYRVAFQTERKNATLIEVCIDDKSHSGSTRRLASTSSCGLCGKESLDPSFLEIPPVTRHIPIDATRLRAIHAAVRVRQSTFSGTGGCHGAAAATASGEILCVFEDIGRHNAVDKVVGFLLENEILASAAVLTVSGRVSFEIVQKCARAGIPVLSAISAPSSLAVETAERWGVTLAGFCRDNRATFYSGLHRVESTTESSSKDSPPRGE